MGAGSAEASAIVDRGEADGAGVLYERAVRYEHGEGIARNHERARELYCAAAERGHAGAEYAIGWMFLNGRGIGRDPAVALAWFRKAAARGHVQAANLAAHMDSIAPGEAAGCPETAPEEPRPAETMPVRAPADLAALVERMAPEYGLDPLLVLSVMAVESAFRPRAVSPKNAQGLMQLIPETAARFGVEDPFDVVANVRGGIRYLRTLLDLFDGRLHLALAAYNAGEGTVQRYGGVPPYPETKTYLERIARHYPSLRAPMAGLGGNPAP